MMYETDERPFFTPSMMTIKPGSWANTAFNTLVTRSSRRHATAEPFSTLITARDAYDTAKSNLCEQRIRRQDRPCQGGGRIGGARLRVPFRGALPLSNAQSHEIVIVKRFSVAQRNEEAFGAKKAGHDFVQR